VNWILRNEHGFADSGHVLDQEMPFGDQTDQGESNLFALALDDAFDVVREP
jgi:hypothetical protein